jgi:uncharacterized membrane protein YraQ (UPF0718 family)/YHS domain-containing protein
MFWETLWALVFGFTLSGFVQAFVSKRRLRATLGNHRPAAVARAAGYGMVSSSCSYAASAMTKSLFAKGADFVTATVFMIASTNLVVELGVVMLVLLGWQFMVAEFVGGPIMIVLVATLGGFVFRSALVEVARRRAQGSAHGHDHAGVDALDPADDDFVTETPWASTLRSKAAWSDAAAYAVADVTMLRRELVVGYGVAGFLAVLVPAHAWNLLFLHGHGVWTSVENALVGPIIAVLSWVCSVGNVPLAAALWSGGISFGGVIAFIFGDLIVMPLILIYRKFYGAKLTLRLVALLYAVMATAGLITQGIFRAVGAVPTTRSLHLTASHVEWDYTTFLDIAFLLLAVVVWWFARHQGRFGGGEGYAIDPVCAMQVRVADAPAHAVVDGTNFYFCSDRCRSRYVAVPSVTGVAAHESTQISLGTKPSTPATTTMVVDPVCGMTVAPDRAPAHREFNGELYYFCSTGCAATFSADSTTYRAR